MTFSIIDISCRLNQQAEAVCRHYLSNGRKEGRYWLVGDIHNAQGRSLFVRLSGSDYGKGAAGKWTDAATGEHGDLLDLIRLNCGLTDFGSVLREAQRFLSLPHPEPESGPLLQNRTDRSPDAAQRLFKASKPIIRTIAETYLHKRGITILPGVDSLRFHPRCYYRPKALYRTFTRPAMIAAVTDLSGIITGAHRTWLLPDGSDKAEIDRPKRAMGNLLGHGVRFGVAEDVLIAGEGIETMLSLRMILPIMPMIAALSANHLSAILFPPRLKRLYIAQDNDPAGDGARKRLVERAETAGIETIPLLPLHNDFNDDLRQLGPDALKAALQDQLRPEDVSCFAPLAMLQPV